MFRLTQIIGGTLVLAGVVAVAFAYFYWNTAVHYGSMAINYARYLDAPKGYSYDRSRSGSPRSTLRNYICSI